MMEDKLTRNKMYVKMMLMLILQSIASLAAAADIPKTGIEYKGNENFLCPEDCHCVLAQHTHQPLLHAKCSSLQGLKTVESLQATLPIHSIDLSYLNLTRLSHSLEKLHDLTSIDLSHNELHEIGHLGRRIKKLNLKHNRFTSAKLTKLPQYVQLLNLQHNDITYLPLELTKLNQLHTLELSHNPINCSCETLKVRNWLQERHVFMEHPVMCNYPIRTKGKSWLQIKQSEICDQEGQGWQRHDVQENELMMGDQPFEEGSGDDEELGKAFIPLSKSTNVDEVKFAKLQLADDVEGSGDLSENREIETKGALEEEDDDGSGSGGGVLIIPNRNIIEDDDNDTEHHDYSTLSSDIFKINMGIFEAAVPSGHTTEQPFEELDPEPIIPLVTDGPDSTESVEDESFEVPSADEIKNPNLAQAGEDDSATYLLLGVILLIVVGLLAYVAIKRCKNRRLARDAENPQRELVDMDKKHLGKPLRNGVPENIPLIKDNQTKLLNDKPHDGKDVKDGGHSQKEPLLNGNGTANIPNEPSPTKALSESQLEAPHEYYPISPRYPTPQSPRASKYGQLPPQEPNNNINNQKFMPVSPKSGRYSPVYSPETGRVKIKLSETPKPKTPMLVTRTRSNAGDIITTPLTAQHTTNDTPTTPTPIHTSATNGHAKMH